MIRLMSAGGDATYLAKYLANPRNRSGRYRALRYCARLPTREAESGPLALCAAHLLALPSDPAVTSNALAIRIAFPLVGATPASSSRPGLTATPGKHNRVG